MGLIHLHGHPTLKDSGESRAIGEHRKHSFGSPSGPTKECPEKASLKQWEKQKKTAFQGKNGPWWQPLRGPSQENERSAVRSSLEVGFETGFCCSAFYWHVECVFIVGRLMLNSRGDCLSQLSQWLITLQSSLLEHTHGTSFPSVTRGECPKKEGHGKLPMVTSSDFLLLPEFTDILLKCKVQSILFWVLHWNNS